MIGHRVSDRYEIEGVLGSGGRGVVYQARDQLLERQVAVKVLRSDVGDGKAEERFLREARMVARLEHPGIVPIYDFGFAASDVAGDAFLVMPRVPGESLRTWIESKQLTPEDAIEIGAQAAEALVYSHSRGVVHRDVKPGNFMAERLGERWRVRLLDFGIAFDLATERLTDEQALVGTPLYLSPEQLLDEELDARTDLYSLGVVLYECVVGRPPITGRIHQLVQRVLATVPPAPNSLGIGLPEAFEELILSCLEKRPERRPPDAGQVRDVLRRIQQGNGAEPLRSTSVNRLRRRGAVVVGRAAEMRLASEGLMKAREGGGQILLVAGEAGIGKSTLLREIEGLAAASQARMLRGFFALRRESSFPYHGFCEAILDYFRQTAHPGQARARAEDLAPIAGDLLRLFPILEEVPELRRAVLDAPPGPVSSAPAPTKAAIFETLARSFLCLGRGEPLVLLLEDLQEADGSVEALQYVFRRLSSTPTLVVATFRTPLESGHPLEGLLEWAAGEPDAESLQLGPLAPAEVNRLVRHHLADAPVSPDSLEVISRVSGGHPLFVTQWVQALLDSGDLCRDRDGVWSLCGDGLKAEQLPASMQRLLRRRLGALPAPALRVLEAASVLGHEVVARELEDLEPSAAEHLDELVSRGFLLRKGGDLSFASGLMRQMSYAGLEESERLAWHRRLAERLEQRHAGRLDRISFRLAQHWREARDAGRAFDYLLRAARHALVGQCPEDAVELASQALELGTGSDLEHGIGQALELLTLGHAQAGSPTQAVDAARRALDLGHATAALLLAAAEAAWSSGRLEEAGELAKRGLETHPDTHQRLELEALGDRVLDLLRLEKNGEAEASTTENLRIERPLSVAGGHAGAAVSLNRLGDALLVQGDYLAAREAYESALAQRGGDAGKKEGDVVHLDRLAQLALKLGDYGEALRCCEQALELAHDPLHQAELEACAGLVCCSSGDFEEASLRVARGFDRLVDAVPEDSRRPAIEARLLRTRGNVWVGLGNAPKALGFYRQALELLAGSEETWERSIAWFNLGEALMHMQRHEEALGHLEQALVEKSALGDRWGLSYVHHAKACILRRQGRRDEALRQARIGLEIARRIGDPKIESMLRIELGRQYGSGGARELAEKQLLIALQKAEKVSARPEARVARRALIDLRLNRPASRRPLPLGCRRGGG